MPEWAKVLIGSLALMIGAAAGPALVIEGGYSFFSKQQSTKAGYQTSTQQKRATDNISTSPATDAADHRQNKSENQANSETEELTIATWRLVYATVVLAAVATVQAGLFVWLPMSPPMPRREWLPLWPDLAFGSASSLSTRFTKRGQRHLQTDNLSKGTSRPSMSAALMRTSKLGGVI
jgi:hypothetical protein